MGEAKLYGQKSNGMSINGIIKDYYAYAGENISAGDLVEYINGIASQEMMQTSAITTGWGFQSDTNVYAVKLDDNRIFLYDIIDFKSVVLKINSDKSITLGTTVDMPSATRNRIIKVTDNKLLHLYSWSGTYGIEYQFIDISDLVIALGTATQLRKGSSSLEFGTKYLHLCLVSDKKVFLAYSYGIYYSLYCEILTINDSYSSVTTGTLVHSSTNYSAEPRKNSGGVVRINDTKVYIVHTKDDRQLASTLCTIDGTAITMGSLTILSSTDYRSDYCQVKTLSNGNVLISYSYNVTDDNLGLYIRNPIDNSASSFYAISSLAKSAATASFEELSDNLVVCTYFANHNVYARLVTISDYTMEIGEEMLIYEYGDSWDTGYTTVQKAEDNIFFLGSYSKGQMLLAKNNTVTNSITVDTYETQVRKVTTGKFEGIAKTSGIGAPEYVEQEVEITKTGNIFPTSWTEVTSKIKYTTSDGWEISTNSALDNYAVRKAFDGKSEFNWRPADSSVPNWVQIKCPTARKITKIKIICYDLGQDYSLSGVFQGSYNGNDWVTVKSFSAGKNAVDYQEFSFTNTDYYQYYKLALYGFSGIMGIYDWQTVEYMEKEIQQVPSTEHKDKVSVYQSTNSFNIIPDNSFENDKWNDINYSSDVSRSGKRSLYFPTGTTYIPNIEIARPIVGHKYYGRRYIKTNGNNQPADCRFEVWGADGANKNWVYAWNNGNYPDWGFDSAVHEIAGVDYPETDRTIIRCFNINTTADTWVDDLLLIDLTEMFGAGKEPTKEWCDANL